MKIRKTATLLALSLLVAASAFDAAWAEDKPEADLTMGFYSQYLWRGFALSRDSLVIQPSMTVSYKGLGVNLWGNLDTEQYAAADEDKTGNFNETDLTLSYDGSAGKIGYGVGYIYYGLDGIKDTQDVYATVSVDTMLSPSLTIYRDITGLKWLYAKAGIGHSLELSKDVSLDLGASVGYLDDNADYNELHDGVLSAAVTLPVAEYLTVSPQLYYSFPLGSKAKDYLKAANSATIDKAKADYIYGGLAVSMAF
jgi:uncharacterized protein (TIGR02001 family)